MKLINLVIIFIHLFSININNNPIIDKSFIEDTIVTTLPKSPVELEYNNEKLLCLKGNINPFSGKVEGMSVFDRSTGLNVGKVQNLSARVYDWCNSYKSFYVIGEIKNGKETGQWIYYYYYEGKMTLMAKIDFNEGLFDGYYILYDDIGSIEYIAEYKENKRNGLEIIFMKDTILHVWEFSNDHLIKEIK